MCRESLPSVKFEISEIEASWLDLTITINETKYNFTLSNLYEPLMDLYNALIGLDFYYRDSVDDRARSWYDFEFTWFGEPWMYMWSVVPLDEYKFRLDVSFTGRDSFYSCEDPWDFSAEMQYEDFLEQVVCESMRMIKTYGFVGYESNWNGRPFPLGQLITLYHVLHKKTFSTHGFSEEIGFFEDLLEKSTK